MLRVEADGLAVVLYGPLFLTQVLVRKSPVVVGISELRVEAYGFVEVLLSITDGVFSTNMIVI